MLGCAPFCLFFPFGRFGVDFASFPQKALFLGSCYTPVAPSFYRISGHTPWAHHTLCDVFFAGKEAEENGLCIYYK